jgi:hypothetical protein
VQNLVGVAEIASGLGLSKQRADALTRMRGFPDPVEHVLVIDGLTDEAVHEFFADRPRIATADETMMLFRQRANRLPPQPRLWRLSVVKEWAANNGREWHDASSDPDSPSS